MSAPTDGINRPAPPSTAAGWAKAPTPRTGHPARSPWALAIAPSMSPTAAGKSRSGVAAPMGSNTTGRREAGGRCHAHVAFAAAGASVATVGSLDAAVAQFQGWAFCPKGGLRTETC